MSASMVRGITSRLSIVEAISSMGSRGLAPSLGVPALALDFCAGKTLDSRITFTRADSTTCATYFDAAGVLRTAAANVPRFDHDPATLVCKGLLIEESRTNVCLRSQDFANAVWTKSTCSVTGTALAPDGTTSAAEYTTTNSFAQTYQTVAVTPSTTYTFSWYAKRGTMTGAGYFIYDNTGAANIVAPTSYYSQITNSGFTRISVTFTTPVGCVSVRVSPVKDSGTTGTIYIWGAQLEVGAFPTSYIPTTTASVTRAADVASMTGTNFSSWYDNSGQGTFLAKFYRSFVSGSALGYNGCVVGAKLSGTDYVGIRFGSGTPAQQRLDVTAASVTQATVIAGSGVANTPYSIAGAFAANDCAASQNGAAVVADTVATIPTNLTSLDIGQVSNGAHLNGHISRIVYYPKRLSNATLQALTI